MKNIYLLLTLLNAIAIGNMCAMDQLEKARNAGDAYAGAYLKELEKRLEEYDRKVAEIKAEQLRIASAAKQSTEMVLEKNKKD